MTKYNNKRHASLYAASNPQKMVKVPQLTILLMVATMVKMDSQEESMLGTIMKMAENVMTDMENLKVSHNIFNSLIFL